MDILGIYVHSWLTTFIVDFLEFLRVCADYYLTGEFFSFSTFLKYTNGIQIQKLLDIKDIIDNRRMPE